MKIEVIKPQSELKWNFPCKGICEVNGLIIGFTKEGSGCVLDKGVTNCDLYTSQMYLDMDKFTPIKEKGNNYDWNNAEFPILVKGIGEDIFTIYGFDEVDNSVYITTFSFSGKIHYWCEDIAKFPSEKDRNKWLKSLEILPKGTEIKITI